MGTWVANSVNKKKGQLMVCQPQKGKSKIMKVMAMRVREKF